MPVKITLRFLGWVIVCVGLTGCAAIAPLTSSITGSAPNAGLEVHSDTSIRLQEGNFVVVRTNVVGSSQGFKLLGFITLRPATLSKAMDQLYADAQAQHGRPQTLANLMIEHTGIYVVLFSLPKVIVRADLIEFIPPQEDDAVPNNTEVRPISRSTARWRPK